MVVTNRWRTLGLVAPAELWAMTLWFSASAVVPELAATWDLSAVETAMLTTSVQIGFVLEALLSVGFTLSDAIEPRYLFAVLATIGAGATAMLSYYPGLVTANSTFSFDREGIGWGRYD